jgi:hypothetical protein
MSWLLCFRFSHRTERVSAGLSNRCAVFPTDQGNRTVRRLTWAQRMLRW